MAKTKEAQATNDNSLLYSLKLKPSFIDNLDELPFPARKYLSHIFNKIIKIQ